MEGKLQEVKFDIDTFEEDLESVNSQNYENMLLVPRDTKFTTIDAFILTNKCLQITKKGKSHFIAVTKCFIQLLEKIRNFCQGRNIPITKDEHDKMFGVYFAVPEHLYNKFGPQAVQCNEDLSEDVLGKTTNKNELIKICSDKREIVSHVEKFIKNDNSARKAVENFVKVNKFKIT